MPKRPPQPSAPRATLALAAIALALFLGGEAFLLSRTDAGRIAAARYLHLGDPAKVTRMIGSQLHRALEAAEVSRDSVSESVVEGGPAPLRWRVGLGPGISALQANYSVSRFLAEEGAVVLSGRERPGDHGETVVTLLLGLPGRPTHELRLVQHPRGRVQAAGGRLAIVVFGFGEDVEQSGRFFDLPAPFAVALVPGGPASRPRGRSAPSPRADQLPASRSRSGNHPRHHGAVEDRRPGAPLPRAGRLRRGGRQLFRIARHAGHDGDDVGVPGAPAPRHPVPSRLGSRRLGLQAARLRARRPVRRAGRDPRRRSTPIPTAGTRGALEAGPGGGAASRPHAGDGARDPAHARLAAEGPDPGPARGNADRAALGDGSEVAGDVAGLGTSGGRAADRLDPGG